MQLTEEQAEGIAKTHEMLEEIRDWIFSLKRGEEIDLSSFLEDVNKRKKKKFIVVVQQQQ